MRVAAVILAALLLSSCTWIRQELEPTPPLPTPKPEVAPPRKPPPPPPPKPEVVPAPQVQQAAPMQQVTAPPVDNTARCHELAQHRADDAKQLGASGADQTQISNDTFRNCMAPPSK